MHESLYNSLGTGFIDKNIASDAMYRPEFLINDEEKNKKILSTIIKGLNDCEEFWFSVAFITTSGVATIIETLKELERRKIKGKILASQYLNFTQPEALKRLMQFENIELKIATQGEFHSKGYLFKKESIYDLIVGSSNLTHTALTTNKEWNLKVCATTDCELIADTLNIFEKEFRIATKVTDEYIFEYSKIFEKAKSVRKKQYLVAADESNGLPIAQISPNLMQKEALVNIENLRNEGKNRALLISATGTGKTYLSAFDVQKFKPKRFLFVVHRRIIAEEAKKTFKSLLGNSITMGIYSGNNQEISSDYLFATIQTISKDEHLQKFAKDHFDYIVIDETHRAGAKSYEKLMNYFEPKFMLGMTATPERTDGLNVFELFDYNIAYEIRLHRALKEKMLTPFHYYGISDLTIDGIEIDDKTEFNQLVDEERVKRIIGTINLYGSDDGVLRGLIFCSRKEECHELSRQFNLKKYRTIALTGDSSEEERQNAIERLESNNLDQKLDFIFTVDIFNEGIDIPKINLIVMLRPTQSAIIFVQQLGRGLRKIDDKEYLTVIDFIGNYANNYLVPIALYGDNSYNKDNIRNLLSSGSLKMPGASTVDFDWISQKKIFEAINNAKIDALKMLKDDYKILKYKIGRIPMMMDFINYGSRDPFLYVNKYKSYYNFLIESKVEKKINSFLNDKAKKILELFSLEINNGKRVEESYILQKLILEDKCNIDEFKKNIYEKFGYKISDETVESCVNHLNFKFITEKKDGKLISVHAIYNLNIVTITDNIIYIGLELKKLLKDEIFKKYLIDSINYSISVFLRKTKNTSIENGFLFYEKYSRKDVFRILNWNQNPVAQNVGGYMVSKDKSNCAIFVNYHKSDNISSTTKYKDKFLSKNIFEWFSKSHRKLSSKDVLAIKSSSISRPLFVKKSNDEGLEFYYMGNLILEEDDKNIVETHMIDDKGKNTSVVKFIFTLDRPVEDNLYNYLTDK